MFKVNDIVVYGSQGVCEITDIEDWKISGEVKSTLFYGPKTTRARLVMSRHGTRRPGAKCEKS